MADLNSILVAGTTVLRVNLPPTRTSHNKESFWAIISYTGLSFGITVLTISVLYLNSSPSEYGRVLLLCTWYILFPISSMLSPYSKGEFKYKVLDVSLLALKILNMSSSDILKLVMLIIFSLTLSEKNCTLTSSYPLNSI